MDLNLSTLIFQIINFLVMVFVLTRFFFKPVLRVLDERSERVTSALDEAEKRERDAAEKQATYEQRLTEAQEQVTVMQQQGQEGPGQEALHRGRRRPEQLHEGAHHQVQQGSLSLLHGIPSDRGPPVRHRCTHPGLFRRPGRGGAQYGKAEFLPVPESGTHAAHRQARCVDPDTGRNGRP